jgi:tetratricopeptide (TPR) repeat protein
MNKITIANISSQMKQMLLLVAFLLISICSFSQQSVYIFGVVKNTDTRKKMQSVNVELLKDGALVDSYLTTASGKFEFDLDFGFKYDVRFSQNGFVTKFLTFNTNKVPEEATAQGFSYSFEMSLFEKIEGINIEILKKPIGVIIYDPEIQDFNYDLAYTQSIHEEVDALRRALEAKKQSDQVADQETQRQADKEEIEQNRLAAEKQKRDEERILLEQKFKSLLVEAETYFNQKNYTQSVTRFQDALRLFPDDAEAAKGLLKAQESKANQEKEKREAKQFSDLVASANGQLIAQDFQGSLETYKQAQVLKPSDAYVNSKIIDIEAVLSNMAETAEKEREELLLQAKYDDFISAADQLLTKESYREAISKYQEAARVKPLESYPSAQIVASNKLMKEAEKKAKADKQNEITEANYQFSLKEADAFFNEGNFEQSITSYNKALGFKSTELYPKEKIELANKALIEKAKREEDDRKTAALENGYKKAIATADEAFNIADYDKSILAYKSASKLKPNEIYPANRLSEIEKIKLQMASDQSKKLEEQKEANEIENSYKIALQTADNLFDNQDFEKSIVAYNNALNIKPLEIYPVNKIKQANKQIKSLATKAIEYEILNEQNKLINDLLLDAEASLNNGEFNQSEISYNQILTIKSSEIRAIDGLEKVKLAREALKQKAIDKATQEKNSAIQAQYDESLKLADAYFVQNQWNEAETAYNNVLIIKANDAYAKDQLKKVSAAIANLAKLESDKRAQLADEQEKERLNALAELEAERLKVAAEKEAVRLKAEAEAKRLAEEARLAAENEKSDNAQKQKELAFNKNVQLADEAYDARKYLEAISYYEKALDLKIGADYPQRRIDECKKAMSDLEALVKQKLQDQKKVDALLVEGNGYAAKKEYQSALESYLKADVLKPNDSIIKQRISAARNALGKLNAEKSNEEKELEKAKKITSFINAGKKAMSVANYSLAVNEFEKAIELEANNREANQLLLQSKAKLNEFLAMQEQQNSAEKLKQEQELLRQKALQAEMDRKESERKNEQANKVTEASNKVLNNSVVDEDEIETLMQELKRQEEQEKYAVILRQKEMLQNWNYAKSKLDKEELSKITFELERLKKAESSFLSREPISYQDVAVIKENLALQNKKWIDLSEEEQKRIKAQLDLQRNNTSVKDSGKRAVYTNDVFTQKQNLSDSYLIMKDRSDREREDNYLNFQQQKEYVSKLYQQFSAKKSYVSEMEFYKSLLTEKEQNRNKLHASYRQEVLHRIDSLKSLKMNESALTTQNKENQESVVLQKVNEEVFHRMKGEASNGDHIAVKAEMNEFDRKRNEELLIRDSQRQDKAYEVENQKIALTNAEQKKIEQQAKTMAENEQRLITQKALSNNRTNANKNAYKEKSNEVIDLKEKQEKRVEAIQNTQASVVAKNRDSLNVKNQGQIDLHANKQDVTTDANEEAITKFKEQQLENKIAKTAIYHQIRKDNKQEVNNVYVPKQQTPDTEKVLNEKKEREAYNQSLKEKGNQLIENNQAKVSAKKAQPGKVKSDKIIDETKTIEGNKVVVQRTITEGNKVDVYKMVVAKWGTFYFLNGKSITEDTWQRETQVENKLLNENNGNV